MPLQTTDLFLIERGGVQYKLTATELAAFVGAATFVTTEVTFPQNTPAMESFEIVHPVPGLLATAHVFCWVVPNDHNDADDLSDDQVRVYGIAETGQIRFIFTGAGSLVGPYTIAYGVT
jgi:hypothetical protein